LSFSFIGHAVPRSPHCFECLLVLGPVHLGGQLSALLGKSPTFRNRFKSHWQNPTKSRKVISAHQCAPRPTRRSSRNFRQHPALVILCARLSFVRKSCAPSARLRQ